METIHLMGGPFDRQAHQHRGGHEFRIAVYEAQPMVASTSAQPVEVTIQTALYRRHHSSMFEFAGMA